MSDLNTKPHSSVVIPSHVPGVGYTLRHRIAVEKLIEYHCNRVIGKKDGNGEVFTQQDYQIMINRAKCHDMDKVLLMLNYPQLTADYFHRIFNQHHKESFGTLRQKSKYDWIEMIFDWESAPYTKPDKGKNAVGVLQSLNSVLLPYCKPYLQLFGFEDPVPNLLPSVAKNIPKTVTEVDLVESIVTYIHTTNIHLFEYMSRLDDKGYMTATKKSIPLRSRITRTVGGLFHKRPSEANIWRSVARTEMIHGTIEAQMFDFDAICQIKKSDIAEIEAKYKKQVELLTKAKGTDDEPLQR